MSFWAGYWKSLKVREVEEPIDVWVHRPVGYVIALLARLTPLTPNQVTVMAIAFGALAGALLFLDFPAHEMWAGLCIFLSAAFDCADGQLARMRGTSSLLGRMLDGVADSAVITAVGLGSAWTFWQAHREPAWLGGIAVLLSLLMAATGPRHTALYDHYKSLYLALTVPGFQEGDDLAAAKARRATRPEPLPWAERLTWPIYLIYLNGQAEYVRSFDPFTTTELSRVPAYHPERAAIYRRHAEPLLKLWRGWFGFGSLIFGFAVSVAFSLLDVYVVFRLVLLHGFYYLYMRPKQRRASAAAFREMAELDAK